MDTRKGYSLRTYATAGDIAAGLAELNALTFGTYEGELALSDEEFMRWHLTWPGIDPALSLVALTQGQVVSNVSLMVAEVRLAGRSARVGLIDLVMTHPDHRGRGLARWLLEECLARVSRQRGFDAAFLYAEADSIAFHLYRKLGFVSWAEVNWYTLSAAGPGPSGFRPKAERLPYPGPPLAFRRAGAADRERLKIFINDYYAAHDSFIPLDDALWRWRKEDRLPSIPTTVYLLEDEQGSLQATATLCAAPLNEEHGVQTTYILTDVAFDSSYTSQGAAELLSALLTSELPSGAPIVTVCGATDYRLCTLFESCGFQQDGSEPALLLPLSAVGQKALAEGPRPLYTLSESLIGV